MKMAQLRRSQLLISKWLVLWFISFVSACTSVTIAGGEEDTGKTVQTLGEKRVIGATATVKEVKTDLLFKARVDTGATTSSLHVEQYIIENEAEKMADNVGKKIRFRMKNHDGESEWLESRIAEVSMIKTSVDQEERYKVLLTLRLYEVKKRVLVTLNDRSHMKYPMLLGRNFLRGDFVVDVEGRKKSSNKKAVQAATDHTEQAPIEGAAEEESEPQSENRSTEHP